MIDYTVVLRNSGTAPAYVENFIDTLPANMDFVTGSVMLSGSLSSLPNSSIVQSGNTLVIQFNTGGSSGTRSFIDTDNTGTPLVSEDVVFVRYSMIPNTSFVIQ